MSFFKDRAGQVWSGLLRSSRTSDRTVSLVVSSRLDPRRDSDVTLHRVVDLETGEESVIAEGPTPWWSPWEDSPTKERVA